MIDLSFPNHYHCQLCSYMSNEWIIPRLIKWCFENSVVIDARLYVKHDALTGIGMYTTEDSGYIPPNTSLVQIPKDAILSVRSCSLCEHIFTAPYGLGAQLALSLALLGELIIKESSPWHGYLQSLPENIVDLPLFWEVDLRRSDEEMKDCLEGLRWLKGTEVQKILEKRTENNNLTLLEEINQYYKDVAEPIILRHLGDRRGRPSLFGFYRAYSLVSSRAFLVDAYHGLSMVPIADAFNHVTENHVHLESDYDVCPECGSLYECPHDRAEDDMMDGLHSSRVDAADQETFYEMVSNTSIPPDSEVFNTYGETLSNAQLLMQYGFILEANENDRISWTIEEICNYFLGDSAVSMGSQAISKILNEVSEDGSFAGLLDLIEGSDLVYRDASSSKQNFYLNADGSLSHWLWILLSVLALCGRNSVKGGLYDALRSMLALQLQLENSRQEDDEDADDGGYNEAFLHANLQIEEYFLAMANSVVTLCNIRKGLMGNSVCDDDLGELLDDLPKERIKTRLALSIALNERSILDSCKATWTELVSFISSSR